MTTQTNASILNDPDLINMLKGNDDPWQLTPLCGYVDLNNKIKGKYGECYTEKFMLSKGFTVNKAINYGHDRIIQSIKTEIKFSLAQRDSRDKNCTKKDVFSFNHFSQSKDWDRAILVGVNIDCNPILVWFDKFDFITNVSTNRKYFSRQQAGTNGNNDDWMFITNPVKWNSFLSESWVKDIKQW